jgi:type IV pilus assembly protein PilQ
LELPTDGPVRQHVAFWLSKPRRLVVDVPGRRSRLARRLMKVDHPLVKRIRVGRHSKKVRFVIETVDAVEPDATVTHRDQSVVVTIRRRP